MSKKQKKGKKPTVHERYVEVCKHVDFVRRCEKARRHRKQPTKDELTQWLRDRFRYYQRPKLTRAHEDAWDDVAEAVELASDGKLTHLPNGGKFTYEEQVKVFKDLALPAYRTSALSDRSVPHFGGATLAMLFRDAEEEWEGFQPERLLCSVTDDSTDGCADTGVLAESVNKGVVVIEHLKLDGILAPTTLVYFLAD